MMHGPEKFLPNALSPKSKIIVIFTMQRRKAVGYGHCQNGKSNFWFDLADTEIVNSNQQSQNTTSRLKGIARAVASSVILKFR
jgi:hypothetical protein